METQDQAAHEAATQAPAPGTTRLIIELEPEAFAALVDYAREGYGYREGTPNPVNPHELDEGASPAVYVARMVTGMLQRHLAAHADWQAQRERERVEAMAGKVERGTTITIEDGLVKETTT